ncbi:SpoIIE family protein phosphatase [Streptomyces pactum]|uniref:SpoIIE family protein phosphatase n=1 Tax=Streptomyces pactum TaxID=68249 RepID=A0ABS0NKN1_9ACTN|nr:SpoIIE family protein phosphatase [Streptomyces pactum]
MVSPARVRRGRAADGRAIGVPSAQRTLIWLNEASSRIGTSLDLQQTAQEFADFMVPRFADGCAVDLLDSVLRGEEGERAATVAPALRAMAVSAVEEMSQLEPDPVGEITQYGTSMALEVVLGRRPRMVTRIRPDEYHLVSSNPSAAEKMRRAGVHSYLAVPLLARGVLLGVADFVRGPDSPPFTRTDMALAVQIASRAAVFVDNARLYGRERQHVVALQRALLPRSVPRTVRLDVSTCYTPAADPSGVGGDWFDVVPLPGGRTALIVGDVMSHGLPAAATMGRLRAVARTLMQLDIAPDRVLARLDLAARDLEEDQVATFLCAIHDPVDRSYTLARAGHIPPLMVAEDGTVRYLDVPVGAPVGAGVIPYDAVRVPAPPGSRLVLFTDGLIKSRGGDIEAEMGRLLDITAGMAADGLDAERLAAASDPARQRFDETAVVVARSLRTDPDGEWDVAQWPLPQDGRAASRARQLAREQLDHWRLSDVADVTELVVSELVGNALRYGHGPGHLRMVRRHRLLVEVSDHGPDLPQIQHSTVSDEGGRGLQLVNTLCRRWGSCRISGGKVVWAEQDIVGSELSLDQPLGAG